MNERQVVDKLKREFVGAGFFAIKHADGVTIGIPDLSVHKNLATTWLEVKVCTNDAGTLRARTVQVLRIGKLARHARVLYVILDLTRPEEARTYIVPAARLNEWKSWPEYAPGLNAGYVVKFVQELHGDHDTS